MGVEGVAQLDRYFPVMAGVALLYLPIVFGLQRFMASRPPFSLRPALAVWNSLLVLFNVYAFYYLAPAVLQRIADGSFVASLCDFPPEFARGPRSHALYLFALSKVPEMIDTLFIVLKKRPLILLHWYHHLTVMLFCWNIVYSPLRGEGFEGAVFGGLNALVHCIMYTSYGLKALGYKPPGDLAITSLQLLQMVVGGWLAIHRVVACPLKRPITAAAGIVMYASYFLLFAHFFYRRYLASPKAKARPVPAVDDKVTLLRKQK